MISARSCLAVDSSNLSISSLTAVEIVVAAAAAAVAAA